MKPTEPLSGISQDMVFEPSGIVDLGVRQIERRIHKDRETTGRIA